MRFFYVPSRKIIVLIGDKLAVVYEESGEFQYCRTYEAINNEMSGGQLSELDPAYLHESVRSGFVASLRYANGPLELVQVLEAGGMNTLPGVPHNHWPFIRGW